LRGKGELPVFHVVHIADLHNEITYAKLSGVEQEGYDAQMGSSSSDLNKVSISFIVFRIPAFADIYKHFYRMYAPLFD
jgi:hypothetical protein